MTPRRRLRTAALAVLLLVIAPGILVTAPTIHTPADASGTTPAPVPAIAPGTAPATPQVRAADASGTPTAADPAPEVPQEWVDGQGAQMVAEELGDEATMGPLVRLRSWAPGFLDGDDPAASPVLSPSWMVIVDVDQEPVALLVVDVDGDTVQPTLVEDAELAGAVTSMVPTSMIVRDQTDAGGGGDAWYAVSNGVVTALNDRASSYLAGPVPLAVYSVALRERRTEQTGAPSVADASASTQNRAVWMTTGAVVLVGLVVVAVTIRHERRVLAPLRDGMEVQDDAGDEPSET